MPLGTPGPDFTDGVDGEAMSFEGINATVSMDSPDALDVGNGNFTVAVWVRLSALTAPRGTESTEERDAAIVSKMIGTNSDGWRLQKQGDQDRFWFCFGGGGNLNGCQTGQSTLVVSELVAPVDDWVHLVGIKDGLDIALYVDGNMEDEGTMDSFFVSEDASLQLGAWNGNPGTTGPGDGYLPGDLDEVLLFDRALSAAEVTSLFAQPLCKR